MFHLKGFVVTFLVLLIAFIPVFTGSAMGGFVPFGIYFPFELPQRIQTIWGAETFAEEVCAAVDSRTPNPDLASAQLAVPSRSTSWGGMKAEGDWYAFLSVNGGEQPSPQCEWASGVRMDGGAFFLDLHQLNFGPYVTIQSAEKYCLIDLRKSAFIDPANQLAYWPRLCWHGAKTDAWIEQKLARPVYDIFVGGE